MEFVIDAFVFCLQLALKKKKRKQFNVIEQYPKRMSIFHEY